MLFQHSFVYWGIFLRCLITFALLSSGLLSDSDCPWTSTLAQPTALVATTVAIDIAILPAPTTDHSLCYCLSLHTIIEPCQQDF